MQHHADDSVSALHAVQSKITRAALDSRRDPRDIQLVAISKTHGGAEIEPILAAGHTVFGENRVQEAEAKWRSLKQLWPNTELHLVGPLQTNKVRAAVALFDVIQTVGRPQLALEIAKEMSRQRKAPRIFVQVNTGAEPQKAGAAPDQADAFIAACRKDYGLTIQGLMCIPPVNELAAPHFALLKKIAERNGVPNLSMGMSADFEIAIQLGATHVRVGSAIFGERPKP
jgi:PLP dependent protein